MKRLSIVLPFILVVASSEQGFGQRLSTPASSLSVQPIFWLDSLVPTEVLGFSVQYELVLLHRRSITARAVWFHDPLFAPTPSRSNGYAFSIEYRHYLSSTTTRWHLGPFAEWVGYEYLGDLRRSRGSRIQSVLDIGVLAGHKWLRNRLVFDISVRTAWYSPATYPNAKYFPQLKDSNFNSQMLLSVGYSIN